MQYEEHHVLTVTDPDGRSASQKLVDPTDAYAAYIARSLRLEPGAKVELRRYAVTIVASSAKAR